MEAGSEGGQVRAQGARLVRDCAAVFGLSPQEVLDGSSCHTRLPVRAASPSHCQVSFWTTPVEYALCLASTRCLHCGAVL